MDVLIIVLVRVVALSGERIFLHFLGEDESGLVTTTVAFGGAAVLLWALACASDQAGLTLRALLPSIVYAGAFALYTAALSAGAVSTVSPWSNLSVLFLFVIAPDYGWMAWLGLAVMGIGTGMLTTGTKTEVAPIWLMIGADVLVVVARVLDSGHPPQSALMYAANLYGWVTVWIAGLTLALGQGRGVMRLLQRRPQWALSAALTNAAAYLSLILLMPHLPLWVIESLGSVAALIATLLGSFWLLEAPGWRKIMASWLMSTGAVLLLLGHWTVGGG